MADNVDLQAKERSERGKNAARRLRASGMVPAVLYGDGEGGTTALAVPDRVVDYTLQSPRRQRALRHRLRRRRLDGAHR